MNTKEMKIESEGFGNGVGNWVKISYTNKSNTQKRTAFDGAFY